MKEMNGSLNVLPDDCVKVNIEDGDWAVFFDKVIDQKTTLATKGGVPLTVKGCGHRVLVPMYKIDEESVSGLANCLAVAKKEDCKKFVVVVHEGESRIGFLAL